MDITLPETVEEFNSKLRVHACSKDSWRPRLLAKDLYTWAQRFNSYFSLNLSTPAIGIEAMGVRTLGSYRAANGFGLDDEVVLNTRHLDRPMAEVLRTLLHEMLHQWQQRFGTPGKNNYHNQGYRDKAKELGIPCDEKGQSLGIDPDSPFVGLLGTNGVPVDTTPRVEAPSQKGPGSKLKKWSCGCTNVRCAVELSAHCMKCHQSFVKEGVMGKAADAEIQDVTAKVVTPTAPANPPTLVPWPFPKVLLAPDVQEA